MTNNNVQNSIIVNPMLSIVVCSKMSTQTCVSYPPVECRGCPIDWKSRHDIIRKAWPMCIEVVVC